jgi:predicted DNA-binding ribbon-helix-helix protein
LAAEISEKNGVMASNSSLDPPETADVVRFPESSSRLIRDRPNRSLEVLLVDLERVEAQARALGLGEAAHLISCAKLSVSDNLDSASEDRRVTLHDPTQTTKIKASRMRPRRQTTLINGNIVISGRRTSIRLEPEMWDALGFVCRQRGMTMHEIASEIARRSPTVPLTAAIRVYLLTYFRRSMKTGSQPP